MTIPVITVDGPSGSGKGTLCQAIAEKLGWHLLDSGAIYRVLAIAAEKHQIAIENKSALMQLAEQFDVQFISQKGQLKTLLEGQDVSRTIRQESVGNRASQIAILPSIRERLLVRQRKFKAAPGLVADGRDMGTIVFPEAPVKIFLDASPHERAKRRLLQLQQKEFDGKLSDLLLEIKARDKRDCNRTVAPLAPASDALIIDSTDLSIDEVIEKVLMYAQSRIN